MKNKKILIIALFLILFCLLGYSKSFAASSNNLEFPEFKDKMTDEYDACFIYKKTSDECIYLVVYSTTYPTENVSLHGYLPYYVKNSSGVESITTGIYRYYKLDNNNNWVLDCYSTSYALNVTLSLDNLYYSSVDIKDIDGNVVFSVPPQVQGIVAQQVEEIQLSQTLEEVLGILPMTLVVLVSLVGLRKGLKMLETFFHQS